MHPSASHRRWTAKAESLEQATLQDWHWGFLTLLYPRGARFRARPSLGVEFDFSQRRTSRDFTRREYGERTEGQIFYLGLESSSRARECTLESVLCTRRPKPSIQPEENFDHRALFPTLVGEKGGLKSQGCLRRASNAGHQRVGNLRVWPQSYLHT